jgi:Na+/proline symporter
MLWVFYQKYPLPIPIPEPRPGIQKFDYIYPIFMLTAVPPVLKGFLIVAILSAAMSSVSSALTSLASVSTMDFVKGFVSKNRSETFFLRFSKISTLFWGAALIGVAVISSREVTFVVDAAFKLRGLTSGALLGGLLLAVFWKKGAGRPVITGMLCSLAVMIAISPLVQANLPAGWPRLSIKIAFPWYTLIGCSVMLAVAWIIRRTADKVPDST